MSDNESSISNPPVIKKRKGFSIASLILSATPPLVLLLVFLGCLIYSRTFDGSQMIWWFFLVAVYVIAPVALFTSFLSLILGIIGLQGEKTLLSWSGIFFVIVNALIALGFYMYLLH